MTNTRSDCADVSLEDQPVTRTGGKYLCGLLRCALADRERVATGDLARRLGVSRASVTEMVAKFGEEGFVDHERYKGATLTDDGESLARHLQWRRCVTERFFADEVDVGLDAETAYRIGFELPQAGTDRLASLVDHPCDRLCQATEASDCPRLTISST
ncbi:metal-dependent transcriptional regulator [Halorhabdus amylolytica]|uniref:metal-dependent transcriptional regulator n=1 Tax=Halorhabdus amylolytica TaxID=2559573 RepID=UPI0010AA7B90|nr:metal-dependent transcriptional regulator [Halorhabdus amylolytica]